MINLTNGWNGPYFQTIRWQTYIESFSPLNFTDFPLVNKMVDPRGIPTGGFGKTWKNLEKPGWSHYNPENPEESSGGPWCRSTPGEKKKTPCASLGGTLVVAMA